MLAPTCHVALRDVDRSFCNLQFAFAACLFASTSFRAMAERVVLLPATHALEFQLWSTTSTAAAPFTILKQNQEIRTFAECVRDKLQDQEKQAESGCPRILSQSVRETFVCMLQLARIVDAIPLRPCWSNPRPTGQVSQNGAIQLCCCANRTRVIHFANSGKRLIREPCDEIRPKRELELVTSLLLRVCISGPNVSIRCARLTGSFS